MFLYDIFIALQAPMSPASFQGILLKRPDVEFAIKKSVSSYRILRDPSKVAAYKEFLTYCETSLTGLDEKPLLNVLLNYLNDTKLDTNALEKLTMLLSVHFQDQNDALSLIPLGRALIDQPRTFAAFLHYLLSHDVTPMHVLSNNLLQDFFRYYLNALAEPNNPIDMLYQFLQTNPLTTELYYFARRNHCEEGGLSSYALDGSQLLPADSRPYIKQPEISVQFTPNEQNLTSLHDIFGIYFLYNALHQSKSQTDNKTWVSVISNLFNQTYTISNELPHLLTIIQEQPTAQKFLAEILTDQTLAILVKNKIGSVLNLIPYRPVLATIIPTQNITDYLQDLRQQTSSGVALFSSLCALFDGIKRSNDEAATYVFDALLDVLIENPCVLDDTSLIQRLRKFPHAQDCVIQKVTALETQLDLCVQSQTQTTVNDLDYITIEDVWRATVQKIQHLQTLTAIQTTCPLDKYKLYSCVAAALCEQNAGYFDLNNFALAVGISPCFESNQITSYERLIIELLSAIDNETIRAQCIEILDMNVTRPWRTALYGDNCLFNQAVLHGNLSLIQWFKTQKLKPPALDALIIDAAQANQWAVVVYLHQHYNLTKITVSLLLHLAVTQHKPSFIPLLWCENRKSPDAKMIEKSLKLAIENSDIESINNIIYCPNKPCDTAMATAFKNAISLNRFDIAKIIAEASNGKLLQYAIDNTVLSAARSNNCELLDSLATLSVNPLTAKVIETALLQATRANHLEAVLWLTNKAPVSPGVHSIKSAWHEANKHHKTPITSHLETLFDVDQKSRKKTTRKRTIKESETHALLPLNVRPMKRTTSCNAMSPTLGLLEHGFFKSVTLTQSEPNKRLARQPS